MEISVSEGGQPVGVLVRIGGAFAAIVALDVRIRTEVLQTTSGTRQRLAPHSVLKVERNRSVKLST